MASCELQLRGRDIERCLRAESGGLDFDVPLAAVGVEGEDVVSKAIAVVSGDPPDAIGERELAAFTELPLLERTTNCSPSVPRRRFSSCRRP